MNLHRIPASTRVSPVGRALHFEGDKRAILLLHGWTGFTARISPLAQRLADEGYTVRLPRLPGHGTNVDDFRASTRRDWMRRAFDEYIDLSDQHEVAGVVGASMGGLLTILLAAQFDIPRIALLAPAIRARNKSAALAPILRYVLPRIKGPYSPGGEQDQQTEELVRDYKSFQYVDMVAELYQLGRHAERKLALLKSDTLIVVSDADEAIPPDVADLITRKAQHANVKIKRLTRSGHQLVQGVEGDTVCQDVVDWFNALR